MHISKQLRSLILVVFVLLAVAAIGFADSSIVWTPQEINVVTVWEAIESTQVSFVSDKNLNKAVVEVSNNLASYVSVEPKVLGKIKKGERITLTLTTSVPIGTKPQTVTGTLVLRKDVPPATAFGKQLSLKLFIEPEVLPPDPGEAGRTTLEGIDADADGLRDDIQRYIALEYWDKPEVKAAVRQYALPLQQALLEADSEESALEHTEEEGKAFSCVRYRTGDLDETEKITDKLIVEMLNTEDRSRAYLQYNQQLGGHVFPGRPLPTEDLCNVVN